MKRFNINSATDHPRLAGDTLILLALLLLGLNFILPTASMLISCMVAGYLVWKANVLFFPALVLLHFSARNFLLEDFGTEDHLLDTLDFAYMRIGGFPLTVGNVVAVVMTARWLYAWYFERNPLLKRHGPQIALWFLALPVSTLITMVAFQKNLLTPTQAIKGLLGFGVFFYGMLLSPSWPMGKGYCIDRLLVIMGGICVLGLFGLCGSNFFFFCLAVGPALAFARLRAPSSMSSKFYAIFALASSLSYAIIGQPGDSMFRSTLTSMGQGILSVVIGLLFVRRTSSRLFYKSYGLAVLASLLFTAYAISISGTIDPDKVLEGTLTERIQFKFYGDRAPLWGRTWDKIKIPPYIIREYRPYIDDRAKEQKYGAHNTYLQMLDIEGWWSGMIFILLILIMMSKTQVAARQSPDVLLKGLYGGLFVICTIGITTGHSAGGGDYLFMWGSLAGLVIGAEYWRSTNVRNRPPLSVRDHP